mgnify:CR=1 FL=1
MRNGNNERPLDVARARALHQIYLLATGKVVPAGEYASDESEAFKRATRQRLATIHKQLSHKWNLDEIEISTF